MGNAESSEMKTSGKVDGRPAEFTYRREDDKQQRQLTWHEFETGTEDSISDGDLIAVLPVHQSLPDDYSILCVKPNPAAKGNSKASPVVFKSWMATKLPGAFIHDYQPTGSACWEIRQDQSSPFPNLHIVVSHGSGMGQAESVWRDLLEPMIKHVCPKADRYELHETTSEKTITDLTKELFLPEANLGVNQAIILLSGDGGMVDILNALLSGRHSDKYQKPNITLLPLGTGNALAHSAGITSDNTMGMKTLLQGSRKELPLFRASFSPGARQLVNEGREERQLQEWHGLPTAHGAVVCSWGLHATLVADSDTTEYRRYGAERFKMAAKDLLFPEDGSMPHPYRGRVSVLRPGATDGMTPSSNASRDAWQPINNNTHGYVLATLVSQLEKGFTISPASRPLDGKLRLVHFGALSGNDAMAIMQGAYAGGKHVEDQRVGYEEVEGVRIDFDEEDDDGRWRRVCVDGKIIRVEKGGWVEVIAGAKGVVDLIVVER